MAPAMSIKNNDPLSFTLMRGYDPVISIVSSFYRPNNLEDLINLEKREEEINQ